MNPGPNYAATSTTGQAKVTSGRHRLITGAPVLAQAMDKIIPLGSLRAIGRLNHRLPCSGARSPANLDT